MFLLNPIGCEIITGYCLIEYVTVTGGTMLHVKHGGACRLPNWIDCPLCASLYLVHPLQYPGSTELVKFWIAN